VKVLADVSIIPLGAGDSLSPYIAACQRVFTEAGLQPRLHAFGTNVEGEWAQVLDAVRRCHEVVHEMGAPRVTATVKLSTRVDRDQTLAGKIESVQSRESQ
jgi:uncharacterized protein (TIGR00106 family)